jgi:membrane protease YdiL (CAAX protease family)
MKIGIAFCTSCGNQLPRSTGHYCPSCGTTVVGRSNNDHFAAAQIRWFIPAIILGFIGAVFFGDPAFQVAIAAFALFVIRRGSISIKAFVGKCPRDYNWWPILFLAVAGLAYSLGAATVFWYPVAKYLPEVHEELQNIYLEGSTLGFFILAVIVAPIVEEVVFRGLLFSRMTEKWGMNRGVIISSFVFCIVHFDLNPIGRLVLGIIACVLYVRTRTLVVPMVFHALNNFIVFLLMLLGLGEPGDTPSDLGDIAYSGLLAMLIASPAVFMVLGRWWPNADSTLPYDSNQDLGESQQPEPPTPSTITPALRHPPSGL